VSPVAANPRLAGAAQGDHRGSNPRSKPAADPIVFINYTHSERKPAIQFRSARFSCPTVAQEDLPMPSFRSLAAALVALAFLGVPQFASAQQFSDDQRGQIESIVKNYLLSHPEVLEEVSAELSKRQAAAEAEKHQAAISQNAETIFNSPRGVTIGNKNGDVSFVEFFDYNCGYCKRAMTDMVELIKSDPKLKVVLKEFPVLGPGSVEAAQVAVAVRMQDPSGMKYLDFHQKLLSGKGQADKSRAMAAAKDAGVDMAKLEKDFTSPEVRATIEENFKLAEAMGMNGTPSYVIGKQVVIGAVGLDTLKEKVGIARCGKAAC
jgi:protein-disulfide isomerase